MRKAAFKGSTDYNHFFKCLTGLSPSNNLSPIGALHNLFDTIFVRHWAKSNAILTLVSYYG